MKVAATQSETERLLERPPSGFRNPNSPITTPLLRNMADVETPSANGDKSFAVPSTSPTLAPTFAPTVAVAWNHSHSHSHSSVVHFLSTNRGRAILLSLLFLIPILTHFEDFKFALTPSHIEKQDRSNELATEAFNSYKLNTPLFEAVKSDDLALTRSLLEGGIDSINDSTNQTASSKAKAIINFYNVNCEDPKGITPLIEATLLGNKEMVEMLLLHGAKAQPAPGYRHTPLRAACLTANVDLITLLLRKGADPNAQSEGGRTPLMGACYLRPEYNDKENKNELSLEAVTLMLQDSRTNPRIRNDFGESALDLCRSRGYNKSVIFLRSRLGETKKRLGHGGR